MICVKRSSLPPSFPLSLSLSLSCSVSFHLSLVPLLFPPPVSSSPSPLCAGIPVFFPGVLHWQYQLGKSLFLLFFLHIWSVCLGLCIFLAQSLSQCHAVLFSCFIPTSSLFPVCLLYLAALVKLIQWEADRETTPFILHHWGGGNGHLFLCVGTFPSWLLLNTHISSLLIFHWLKITCNWQVLTVTSYEAPVVCWALMSSSSGGCSTIPSACQPAACYLMVNRAHPGALCM